MSSIRISEEAGVRYLQFGAHWIQGAMRINRPWSLELEYSRDMMFPLLLRSRPWPRRILQVGLGAGSTAKFLYRHLADARIEVVEIDPQVAITAWQCFHLPEESRRFRVEIEDGYRHLARSRRTYDLILLDGFDAKAEPGRMDSPAFYRHCQARLARDGLLVVNLLSKRGPATAGLRRLQSAFSGRVVALPRNEANTIAIATLGRSIRCSEAELRQRATALRRRTGLNLLPTIGGYFSKGQDRLVL
jgi:spermidine synthase